MHHPLHLIELPELLIQNPKPSDLPVVQRIVDGLSQYLMPVNKEPALPIQVGCIHNPRIGFRRVSLLAPVSPSDLLRTDLHRFPNRPSCGMSGLFRSTAPFSFPATNRRMGHETLLPFLYSSLHRQLLAYEILLKEYYLQKAAYLNLCATAGLRRPTRVHAGSLVLPSKAQLLQSRFTTTQLATMPDPRHLPTHAGPSSHQTVSNTSID